MASIDKNLQFAKLCMFYRTRPVQFALDVMGMELSNQQEDLINEAVTTEARVAVKSATGTGKTTALAVIIFHQLACEPDCKIIMTAPSGQLKRGIRAELSKRHQRMQPDFKAFFDMNQELVFVVGRKETQFCSLVTGSAENKESLAGVHADKVLILIDEASSIEQEIYDTLVGNLTTAGSIIQTSNPVRSVGNFYNLFSNPKAATIWKLLTFTAFDSPFVSKSWTDLILLEYGEDSDFYRMRVLGEFARATSTQYISTEVAESAVRINLDYREYHQFPKVMGVDVARFGDDSTVLVVRQGPKILDIQEFKGLDNVEVAGKVLEFNRIHQCESIFVDSIGVGSGVFDVCKHNRLPVVEVVVSAKPTNPKHFANLRSQLWGSMKDWLQNGADLPFNDKLVEQLGSMEYGYNGRMQIQLISKKDLKKRGFASPDIPDAIALTFAMDIFGAGKKRFAIRTVRKSQYLWC